MTDDTDNKFDRRDKVLDELARFVANDRLTPFYRLEAARLLLAHAADSKHFDAVGTEGRR